MTANTKIALAIVGDVAIFGGITAYVFGPCPGLIAGLSVLLADLLVLKAKG